MRYLCLLLCLFLCFLLLVLAAGAGEVVVIPVCQSRAVSLILARLTGALNRFLQVLLPVCLQDVVTSGLHVCEPNKTRMSGCSTK